MSKLPIVEIANASDEVVEVYHDFKIKMGFPEAPNFIKAQGASTAVVRGTWALVKNILVDGLLPRSLKEMAFVAISKDRNCQYCEAAHLACCRMLGIDIKTLETLVTNIDDVSPVAVREVLRFSIKCSRSPQMINNEDFNALKNVGFSAAEITEIVAMSALAVYANTIADALGIEADQMFGMF